MDGAPIAADGKAVSVNPGPHTFKFVTADGRSKTVEVVVVEGKKSQEVPDGGAEVCLRVVVCLVGPRERQLLGRIEWTLVSGRERRAEHGARHVGRGEVSRRAVPHALRREADRAACSTDG